MYAPRRHVLLLPPHPLTDPDFLWHLPQPPRKVTVETLSTAPRVLMVEGFLNADECERIIAMASDKMDRSTIAEAGTEAKNGIGSARTSSTAWLTKDSDLLVTDIRERVADLVKVPMHLAEDMQVLHYSKSEHYWAHHDYFDPNIYRGFVTSPGQNRFITVFFYLSDVEEGGETVFPFANGDDRRVTDFADCSRGLRVKPKAGNAIIFYSLLADKQQMVCPEVPSAESESGSASAREQGIGREEVREVREDRGM